MPHIAKMPTEDGTYTVYLESQAVAWGLSSSAADALIERLTQATAPLRIIA